MDTTVRRDLPRSIGFWGGSAIMVGIIIGSGIFRTPASIAREMGSPWLILSFWLIGGVFSLFGALTFAELGTMFPRSGGIYVYLYEAFGELVAFIFGWTYLFLGKPLAAAGIAFVFSEHVNRLIGVNWDLRVTTCVTLALFTAINTVRVELGAGLAILFTGLKVAALLAIIILGLPLALRQTHNLSAGPSPHSLLLAISPVLSAILWTYDGWADIVSCSGEVREPQRLLPRILLVGTVATIAIYLAVNAIYMAIVPLNEMRNVQTVAPVVMRQLIGPRGDWVVTLMICISTLGATHGSIITGARVTYAQANDGLLFKALARVHPTFKTPHVSLWLQCAMSCLGTVVLNRFERMIDGFVFTMWIFFAAVAASVILLRIRRPAWPRPYRCWGYPWIPIGFILAAIFLTVIFIQHNPVDAITWIAILLAGVPTYFIWRWFVPRGPVIEHDHALGVESNTVADSTMP